VQLYETLLMIAACFFAASMGYHYAGAVVGPAYGGGAIPLRLGLLSSALLVVIGSLATPVVYTYVALADLDDKGYLSSLLASSITTTIATYARVPTSTIQIFAFSVLGSAVASSSYINWGIALYIALSWALAPSISYAASPWIRRALPARADRKILLATMAYSALILGMNDVSNAASPMIGAGINEAASRLASGALMGAGMIIWGSRLARLVGEEIGVTDTRSFIAAHITKSLTLTAHNVLGLNASMNQTLIGALAGLGAERRVITKIVLGWIYSPAIGFSVSVVITKALGLLP